MTGRDTSPGTVATFTRVFRDCVESGDYDAEDVLAACDLIDALAADLARVVAERDAAVARAEADRLVALEEYVREHGMNVDDDVVDSCASGSVYRAMLDLAEAGRMVILPGGVGRRVYGRWITAVKS